MPVDEQPFTTVWTRPRRGQREQPALSRDQIVSEAVALLDAEGIDALSMRRLGTKLGAGATSIYWHVANKDELIELVVDEVFGEIETPDADDPAGWRVAAILCAHSLRSVILRHPWVAPLLGEIGTSYLGPNVMRLSDRMVAMFDRAGFALEEAEQAMSSVAAYVMGIATSEAAWLTTVARSGRTEQEWTEYLLPAAEAAAEPYPRLRELYAMHRSRSPEGSRESGFDYGLELILDGLQVRLNNSADKSLQ